MPEGRRRTGWRMPGALTFFDLAAEFGSAALEAGQVDAGAFIDKLKGEAARLRVVLGEDRRRERKRKGKKKKGGAK